MKKGGTAKELFVLYQDEGSFLVAQPFLNMLEGYYGYKRTNNADKI
jgi:hypothetical protein